MTNTVQQQLQPFRRPGYTIPTILPSVVLSGFVLQRLNGMAYFVRDVLWVARAGETKKFPSPLLPKREFILALTVIEWGRPRAAFVFEHVGKRMKSAHSCKLK